MKLPVKPVVLPKDLKGQTNGLVDDALLRAIPGGKLHHLAAQAWLALREDARKSRLWLKPTSHVDTYRPLKIQEKAFFARYDNTPRDTRHEKYQGKDWWLKPRKAGVAVPGTSFHGWGLAIDIASMSERKLAWLLANAARFGFSWESQSEPWHLRYVAGDRVPPAVK